jgi:tetratricopeptide (TPR) repeat protein
MADLPIDLDERVADLIQEGEDLLDDYDQEEAALACFQAGWDLLPEPKPVQGPAMNLLAAMGDCYFFLGRWEDAYRLFQRIIITWFDMVQNPYIRVRLGQCLLEMGDEREASNWFFGAYQLEGTKAFENEEPKYLDFLTNQMVGWPERWKEPASSSEVAESSSDTDDSEPD